MNVTVNDLFHGAVLNAIKMIEKDTKEKRVFMSFIASTAPSDKDLVNFSPKNEMAGSTVHFSLKDDLISQVQESKRVTDYFRDGKLFSAINLITKVLACIPPNFVVTSIIRDSWQKNPIICSNMAASREHVWSFDGNKTHWVTIATSGGVPICSLVTLADKAKLTITARTGDFSEGKALLALIEENLIKDK